MIAANWPLHGLFYNTDLFNISNNVHGRKTKNMLWTCSCRLNVLIWLTLTCLMYTKTNAVFPSISIPLSGNIRMFQFSLVLEYLSSLVYQINYLCCTLCVVSCYFLVKAMWVHCVTYVWDRFWILWFRLRHVYETNNELWSEQVSYGYNSITS